MIAIFQDRQQAGRALAHIVRDECPGDINPEHTIVLGLPRGGVPVAFEVARELHLPLDVFVVRKLGVPGREELAMGAIASGGAVVIQSEVMSAYRIGQETIDAVAARERLEIERREAAYRTGRPPLRLSGSTVILIDDGLATGSTMKAAARALRPTASRIVVAIPVAAASTCQDLRHEVDQLVCLQTPEPFYAVGGFYRNFGQTTDAEVRALLSQSQESSRGRRATGSLW